MVTTQEGEFGAADSSTGDSNVCVCVHACVCACMCVCVRARVCACVCVYLVRCHPGGRLVAALNLKTVGGVTPTLHCGQHSMHLHVCPQRPVPHRTEGEKKDAVEMRAEALRGHGMKSMTRTHTAHSDTHINWSREMSAILLTCSDRAPILASTKPSNPGVYIHNSIKQQQ